MAYEKTVWKARQGSDLSRFNKLRETGVSVALENAPINVTEPGTPFSVNNMNHIEQGICDAHELIAAEEQARIQGDEAALEAAKNYTNEKIAGTAHSDSNDWATETELADAVGAHNTNEVAHADIRQELAEAVGAHNTDEAAHADIRRELAEAVGAHNTDEAAHADIRREVSEIGDGLETLDGNLRELSGRIGRREFYRLSLAGARLGDQQIAQGYFDITVLNDTILVFKLYAQLPEPIGFCLTNLGITLNTASDGAVARAARLLYQDSVSPFPGVFYHPPQMGGAEAVSTANDYRSVPLTYKRAISLNANGVYNLSFSFSALDTGQEFLADIVAVSGIVIGGDL